MGGSRARPGYFIWGGVVVSGLWGITATVKVMRGGDIVRPLIILGLIVLGVVVCLMLKTGRWANRAERKLDTLAALSKASAAHKGESFPGWRDLVVRGVTLGRGARSYCARTTAKNRREGEAVLARVDAVRPDRYHVTKFAWSGPGLDGVQDEWVSIGEDSYRNCGLWIRADSRSDEAANRALGLDVMLETLEALQAEEPIVAVYEYEKVCYVLLEYDRPVARGAVHWAGTNLADGMCHVQVWINRDTAFLCKAQILVRGMAADSRPIDAEVTSVFACFNERVRVQPPPWLNAVRVAGGGHQVVRTRVPILSHYGSRSPLQAKFPA